MQAEFYSVSDIRNTILGQLKKNKFSNIYLIFYLVRGKSKPLEGSNGIMQIELTLKRKAIPMHLKDEFVKRFGEGMQEESNVLAFVNEYDINYSEEQIDEIIRREYSY